MNFGKGRRRYNRTLMLGNIFMIPASLSNYFLTHHTQFSGDLTDGIVGLLYGLTIGCYIVGLRRMMRDDPRSSAGSCA